MNIASTAVIHPNVHLGANVTIEDFVVIGIPPSGKSSGEIETVIGANAIIRSHSVIYAGNIIGENLNTGHHVMIREMNVIGNDVNIGTNTVIEHHVVIEDEVRIHSCVFIPEYSELHEGVWIGPNVVITNDPYPAMAPRSQLTSTKLMRGAKIGANCTLLPGIVVGENALVGAGALVVKDVPPGKVIVGIPATEISEVTNLPYNGADFKKKSSG